MSLLNQEIKIKLEAAPTQEAKREVMKEAVTEKFNKIEERMKKIGADIRRI